MVDYKVDDSYDLDRNDWGAFNEVDGLKEFEQTLATTLHGKVKEIIPETGTNKTDKEVFRLAVYRTAQVFDVIGEVKNVEVSETLDAETDFVVEVYYRTNRPFKEIF